MQKETKLVLAFAALYFLLLVAESPKYGIFWDEGGHLAAGFFVGEGMKTFAKTLSVQQTLGHLRDLSERYNAFIVLHYPPIFYALEGMSFAILGPRELAGKLVSMLFSVGAILVTYRIGKDLFGGTAGLVSAVFLAASPLFFRSSLMAMMDTASAFFFALSVYAFVRFLNGKTSHIVLGIVLGLALLTRFEALLLFGIFILHLAVTKRLQKYARRMGIAFSIALLMAAPWYFISLGRANPDTGTELAWFFDIVFKRHHGGASGFDPVYFAKLLLPSLSPIAGLLSVLGFCHILLGNRQKERLIPLAWIAVTYLFFSVTPVRLPRYSIYYLPAFALLAGNFTAAFSDRVRIKPGLLAALVIAALVLDVATYAKNVDAVEEKFANYQYRIPAIEQAAQYLAERAEGKLAFQLTFRNEVGPATLPFYLMTKYAGSGVRYRDIMSLGVPEEGNLSAFRATLEESCPEFVITLSNKEMNENALQIDNITRRYAAFVASSESFVLDKKFESGVADILIYRRSAHGCLVD